MADTTVQSKAAGGSETRGFGTPRAKTGTVNKRLMNVIDAELKVSPICHSLHTRLPKSHPKSPSCLE